MPRFLLRQVSLHLLQSVIILFYTETMVDEWLMVTSQAFITVYVCVFITSENVSMLFSEIPY